MKCYKCKVKLKKGEMEYPKCGRSLKELKKARRKRRLIKLIIFILIIAAIVGIVKLNKYIQNTYNNDQIKITSLENSSKTGDILFIVSDKINNIDGEILTFKKVESGHIKLYVGNLVLAEKDLTNKKFSINDFSLAEGANQLDVSFVVKGKEIKRTFYILNLSKDNMGNLDSKDEDGDKIPNYLEDAFKTNKNSMDTDNDGLSDFEEIYKTYTDPINAKTYNNTFDADFDSDNDNISNVTEIRNNTNPINDDTDGDGLKDGEELQIKSSLLKKDTDEDGISDYDEVMNFASSPLEKDTVVSGNIYNKDNVIITMQNVKVEDLNKISVVEGGYALLNEKMDGYIMPPYKINTEISGTSIISFNLNDKKLKDDAIPTIYEIDLKTQGYKELETYESNGRVYSAYAVNKDNLYMVFDKNTLTKEFNGIKVGKTEVEIEVPKYTHYMITDIPIVHLFVKDSIKIFCYGDFDVETHKEIEKIIESEVDGLVDIEFIEINGLVYEAGKKIQEWATDAIFNHLDEDDKDMVEELQCINPESKGKKVVEVGVIADFAGIEDLEKYFYGDNKGRLSTNIKVKRNMNGVKDTNDDGLNDVITELIIAGKITTEEGYNPFEGLTLEQVNKNADFDNDTLKNGDEIKVVEKDGFYVLEMFSDPTKKDTDDDGLFDPKDPYPLVSFDSRYVLRNSLQGEPTNVYDLMKDVENTNKLYNRGKETKKEYRGMTLDMIEYTDLDGTTKYSPNCFDTQADIMGMGAILGYSGYGKDAAKAFDRYHSATGRTYTEKDATKGLREDHEIKYFFDQTINDYKNLAESAVADGQTLIFENKNLMLGTDPTRKIDGEGQSTNVFGFLHSASSNSIAKISNNNGLYYIKMRYFLEDIYDWKRDTYEIGLAGQIEVMYFNKLLLGQAKVFLVHIEYDAEIIYDSNTGETKVIYFDTPRYK